MSGYGFMRGVALRNFPGGAALAPQPAVTLLRIDSATFLVVTRLDGSGQPFVNVHQVCEVHKRVGRECASMADARGWRCAECDEIQSREQERKLWADLRPLAEVAA